MRLTVFTDYGLRVLMVLAARRDTLLRIVDIAEAFDISEAHLMKVTHTLGQTEWVETVRGRNGGMRLVADPGALKLDAIVRKLEGDVQLVACFHDPDRCVLTGACNLEHALAGATDAFFRELGRYSLADLASGSAGLSKLPIWQPLKRREKAS
jgi:Rrf2 family nitric oxide-sensitive transcriptional repressor